MNEPFLSDFVSNLRVTPSVCSIVILASGTGFPCASTTVPVIMPCAAAGSAKPRTTKLTSANCHANRLENRRIIANPPEEFRALPSKGQSTRDQRRGRSRASPVRGRQAPAAARPGSADRSLSFGAAGPERPAHHGRVYDESAGPGPAVEPEWPAEPGTRRTARHRARESNRCALP